VYSTTHSKVKSKVRNILVARKAWELPSVSSEGHLKAACSSSKYQTQLHEDGPRKSETRKVVQINQPTRCNNFSSLLLDVYVQLNMFQASSSPSSGAQLQ